MHLTTMRNSKVVWQILNALRAHDDRFYATINKMDLGVNVSDHIEIIAVSNTLPGKQGLKREGPNIGSGSNGDNESLDNTSSTKTAPSQRNSFLTAQDKRAQSLTIDFGSPARTTLIPPAA